MTSPLLTITDPAKDAYASLRLIEWWDQERVRRARVLVAGAGALGNEVLKNLALVGVGQVIIVDFDRIEMSNLTRSVLFRRADAGREKALVAAERVREINPDVAVTPITADLVTGVGQGIYRRVDLILGCLDSREARIALNRGALRSGTPWIDGALDVLAGSVKTFVPSRGACYECAMTPEDYAIANLRYSCPMRRPSDIVAGRAPTTPTSASIIGAIQVQEALKMLHGLPVEASKGILYSGESARMTVLSYTRRRSCGAHKKVGAVIELERGVADLTVGSLLELAQPYAGQGAALELSREIVQSFHCPSCGSNEPVFRPFDDAVPASVACDVCRGLRIPSVVCRVHASEHARDVPLAQLGIPPLDVVRVEGSSGRVAIELSGDAKALFGDR